ncbi:hypothetical protein PF008_g15014 [Phytophthora fragariae]|uniref:Protein kinase domain-containing protein n=1 Tax=Phytophthora fragariae TaxID=53985 RepID=A0A6G0RFI0_9STRA|nr:hypothetical protein PF008_g15014 [Phytophthora fragariae]
MHSFVYKARRKRSIEYVAVKSTAKSRMDKILNEVPFLHKLDSRYVLKFFDWYESSNHIWLILEYCMGGDLLNLITQDKQLPETAVKSFGIELVAGLQYLHANSILYCDLKPANVLIDEFGSLKLADFGLARRIPGSDTAATRPLAPGSPHYMAPELFQQPAVHSFASDFWALGCVLYELRTGRQPFTHTNFSELARKIQTDTVVLPVPGYEMSPVFCNLLQRLLVKDPYQRITWNELIDHPFWDNLPQLEDVVMPAQEMFDAAAPTPGRYPNISAESSDSINFADHPHDQSDDQHENNEEDDSTAGATGAVQRQTNGSGPITTVTEDDRAAISESGDSSSEDLLDGLPVQRSITSTQVHDEARPVSAPSSRMRATTSNNEDLDEEADAIEDQHIGSIPLDVEMRHRWRAAKAPHSAPPAISNAPRRRIQLHSLFDRDGVPGGGLRKVSKLIFTAADCRVKSIIGNKDIQIGDLPRIRAEHLRFEPTAPQDLLSCSTEALESQLKDIYVSLKSSQAGDTEKLSVMAYLFSLSCHARLAHVIVNSSILKLLIRMLTHESRLSVANRVLLPILCLVLGVLFRFATFIAPSSPDQLRQLVTTLLQVLHDSPSKSNTEGVSGGNELESRSLALGCLGELLFYISTQQEWELPMDGVDGVLTRLLNYFMGNDNKQYTFFLRLMAKLLTAFPNEELSISRESDTTTVAFYASKILLNLFESSAREANNIVLVETHVLFTHLLPAVLVHISPTEGSTYGANNDGLAVNCLKILHVVLLDFDYEDDNGEYELYDHFIRSTLVPCLDSLLNEHAIKVESTWSLASELLFGLISSDSSLLSEAKELRVMSAILGLLSVSPKFQALPSHATQLLNVLVDSYNGHLDELYESGIAESVVAGLAFATRRKVLDTNLVDLLVVLQHLLHQQHDSSRQQSLPAAPQGFNELVRCGPILIQLCVGTDAKRKVHGRLGDLSPEEDEIEGGLSPRGRNRVEDDKIADLVSRCLVFLSQIFGEQLNEAVFLNGKEPVNEYLSSLLLLCLQPNDLNVDGVVMLRLLLMLKNCLRCEGNNAYVSNWMTEDSRVLKAVKELASQHQDVRLENERGKSGQQRSVPSIGEQISRTSAAIVRLCRS